MCTCWLPEAWCRQVEVVALLQYVANQLKCCESLDLLLLKEMVQTMTVRGKGDRPLPQHNFVVLPLPVQQYMRGCQCVSYLFCMHCCHRGVQGHQAVFEVSEPQLDALAGSDTLAAVVITQVRCLLRA